MASQPEQNMTHQNGAYRPEIDGLRAIAVLIVLLYHFQFDAFAGGYVGVDVFFVISGFLITGQVMKELRKGTFSVIDFYRRRIRRLFPALFCMVVATLAAGFFILTPGHLATLGESALFASFSLSNLLFYSQSGYFDTSAIYKPLLHTWSLGVEEQFYLFWPLLLLVLVLLTRTRPHSERLIFAALLLVGTASLALSQYLLKADASAAFYLPHSRIFQFCIGGLLAIYQPAIKSRLARELLLLVGLAMILYPAFMFTHQTPFPGINALYPSIGTMLVICAGQSTWLGAALTNPLSAFTGRISYSLYLYHWPLVVFYVYVYGDDISTAAKLGLLGASYILGYLSYALVETPFRRGANSPDGLTGARFPTYALMATLPVVFVSANMWGNAGWTWRFQQLPAENIEELFDLDSLRVETLTYFNENVLAPYFALDGKRQNVLVIGDSHGRDASNALKQALVASAYDVRMQSFDDDCIFALTNEMERIPATNQKNCATQASALQMSLKVEQADIVVISAAWSIETARRSTTLANTIRTASKGRPQRIVVFGRTPDFFNFQADAIALLQQGKSKSDINQLARKRARINTQIDELLEERSDPGKFEFRSKTPIVCPEDACDIFTPDGSLTIWDHNHWTLHGARHFGARMAKALELEQEHSASAI
jgi:peptidoglycan/LPS O-acetylase OafA/YrhL